MVGGLGWRPSEPSQLPPGHLEEEPNSDSTSSRHVFVLMSSLWPRPLPVMPSRMVPPQRVKQEVYYFRHKMHFEYQLISNVITRMKIV